MRQGGAEESCCDCQAHHAETLQCWTGGALGRFSSIGVGEDSSVKKMNRIIWSILHFQFILTPRWNQNNKLTILLIKVTFDDNCWRKHMRQGEAVEVISNLIIQKLYSDGGAPAW